MPNKQFMLDGGLPVTIHKRKTNRSLRLSISAHGDVRVTIPSWAPYSAGLNFARSKQDWIMSQRVSAPILTDGQPVGKAHHLRFQLKNGAVKPSSRVSGSEVIVSYPPELGPADDSVQEAARKGCVRALRSQAEQLLPQRLANLARAHGFDYSGVQIKLLKGRWGSCDHNKLIVLNLYLMLLPWEYIDYVLLHELTHTRVMRHGPDFWKAMAEVQPGAAGLRKSLKNFQPALNGPPEPLMT